MLFPKVVTVIVFDKENKRGCLVTKQVENRRDALQKVIINHSVAAGRAGKKSRDL